MTDLELTARIGSGGRQILSGLGPDYRMQLRAELEAGRLLRLGIITVEFALIVAAVRLLDIETQSFEQVLMLALGGFVVNHFLPAVWRQSFFAALSVTSVLLVFGWSTGATLLAMGSLLIALCHLPFPLRMRMPLILLIAAGMALERKQLLPLGSPVPGEIWPILGAMFMFRLIVYLYDLANRAAPFGVGRALSYFFMLPNVCFPLFPVIDYKTLQRSAYNDDALKLYQTGAKWMLRGLIHLALYKVVYYLFVIEPSEAVNGTGAARYMVSTYLLYLKISGLFHFIVGLLRMYGFGLAETHHLYLFSSSFTDFWRRINIYWKDFIQKLVFNPIYFATRGLGTTGSLVIATLFAFVLTWLFHSYQWFWIRGTFPIVWSDVVFWLGLGFVVLVNVLIETRLGRRRSLGKQTMTLGQNVKHGLKIAGTFAAICVLWTVWCTPEIADLGFVWRAVLNSGPADIAVLVGIPLGIGALGVIFGARRREVSGGVATEGPFWRQAATVTAGACGFIVLALWPALLTPVSPKLADMVRDMDQGVALNAADSERFKRGYYEDLTDVTRFNNELWMVYAVEPDDWGDSTQDQPRNDAIREDYVANTVEEFKGAVRTINSHGMRDREYTVAPGPNTFRIALIGSSNDMGAGVKDDETYENVVEKRLNLELGPRTGFDYEILNFSRGGFSASQKLAMLRDRALAFQPDLVLYAATTYEFEELFGIAQLEHLARYGLLNEFPAIVEAMDAAGVTDDPDQLRADKEAIKAALRPFAEDTLKKVLEAARDLTDSHDTRMALLLIEIPTDSPTQTDRFDRVAAVGRAADLPVLDLKGAFADIPDRSALWIAPWDAHPNALGHRMLADRLYELLLKQRLVPTKTATSD